MRTVTHGANLVVTTREGLDALVEEIFRQGAFSFDVETRGDLGQHPDLTEIMEAALAKHISGLKNRNANILAKTRENFEEKYRKQIAVDPTRNDLFWIGLATSGQSWAIPMGHRHGVLIEPEEIGDGSTVPPPGYRKLTSKGRESMAKARYRKPAVFGPPPPQLARDEVLEALRPLFFSDLPKVAHNIKFDARTIGKYYGELPSAPYVDTMLLQHYLNENLPSYSLERLIAHNYGGHDAYYLKGKLGKNIDNVSFYDAAVYLHLDVRWTWMLYKRMQSRVDSIPDLEESFDQEMEVMRVLARMEDNGIPVDFKAMEQLGTVLDAKLRDIKADVIALSYPGFNPDSTNDKQKFLFGPKDRGNLGLKPVKYTANGAASTDAESLQSLAGKHPLIEKILEWQEYVKLKGTYVDGLLPKINAGRIHPSFHLHRTSTGRLASSDPNIQNIPRGSEVRGLFVAEPGYELLVADYSAIEMRIMAMFSRDKELLRIFELNLDIHAGTAAVIFQKHVDDVTKDERHVGKTVNFLTGYGGGAKLLAARAGIPVREAKDVLDGYYEQFADLTKWKNKVVAQARAKGYVCSISGRRRRLPDINSTDDGARARAERQAVNAVVQGTASDICKRAMVDVDHLIIGTKAQLLVQVHDELVMMSPLGETEYYQSLLMKGMGHGTVMQGVELKVDCHAAQSWAEAKG